MRRATATAPERAAAFRQESVSAVPGATDDQESDMISEVQVHVIARQMLEKHGFEAIAQARPKTLGNGAISKTR
jgi:hypothetical protein